MLHFKPFGKTFNTEFINSPFLETVKIKIVISLVTTSGNIDFDFTEKSQYFIGKHIRNRILSNISGVNGPLKFWHFKLVSKISQEVFELLRA